MNKKIISAVAVTAAVASMSAAYAQDITVSVDGKGVDFDQLPVIENDRTLVPMRAIFEALGATVEWDGDTRTVTSTKGETVIKLTIDSADMYIGSDVKKLDVPAKIINDRTMVPVRAISEAFECKVDWDGANQAVIITTSQETAAPSETTEPSATTAPAETTEPSATAAPSSGTSTTPSSEAMPAKDGVNTYVPILSVGVINTETGELDSSAVEKTTTDYTPVNGGKQYFAAIYHPNVYEYTNLCNDYAFYDKDKKFISGAHGDMSKLVTAPADAAYIRFSMDTKITSRNTLYVNFMETTKAPTDFTKSEAITKNAKTDKLNDKTIYFVGDVQLQNGDNWLCMMDTALNAKQIRVNGQDGLRYTAQTGIALAADSFVSTFPKTGFDIVVLQGGSYDWMMNMPIADFEKAVTNAIQKTKKQMKDADIYVTTLLTSSYPGGFADGLTNDEGKKPADYTEVIKKVAAAEKVNVIDLASLWKQEDVEKYLRHTDGDQYLFANDDGAALISNAIVEALTK